MKELTLLLEMLEFDPWTAHKSGTNHPVLFLGNVLCGDAACATSCSAAVEDKLHRLLSSPRDAVETLYGKCRSTLELLARLWEAVKRASRAVECGVQTMEQGIPAGVDPAAFLSCTARCALWVKRMVDGITAAGNGNQPVDSQALWWSTIPTEWWYGSAPAVLGVLLTGAVPCSLEEVAASVSAWVSYKNDVLFRIFKSEGVPDEVVRKAVENWNAASAFTLAYGAVAWTLRVAAALPEAVDVNTVRAFLDAFTRTVLGRYTAGNGTVLPMIQTLTENADTLIQVSVTDLCRSLNTIFTHGTVWNGRAAVGRLNWADRTNVRLSALVDDVLLGKNAPLREAVLYAVTGRDVPAVPRNASAVGTAVALITLAAAFLAGMEDSVQKAASSYAGALVPCIRHLLDALVSCTRCFLAWKPGAYDAAAGILAELTASTSPPFETLTRAVAKDNAAAVKTLLRKAGVPDIAAAL